MLKDLIQANEFGVALEFVCEWLYEAPVPISIDLINKIEEASKAMGLDGKYLSMLRSKNVYR
jgi:hypothetical protein